MPSHLDLSLPFLLGVEDQPTQAYWWAEGFGFLEVASPSLKYSSPHIASSGGMFWMMVPCEGPIGMPLQGANGLCSEAAPITP